MRRKLQSLEEKRRTFTGFFERIGFKPGYRGRASTMTVLLVKVKDNKGRLMTDHLWFNYTKGFQELNLTRGEKIEFKARVKEYQKGSGDTVDYKLSNPSQIRKLSKTDSKPVVILRRK
jgi:hypothetical protein